MPAGSRPFSKLGRSSRMQTKTFCRSLILGVVWAAAAALTGCGGSTARIARTVTHNGEPVRGAEVAVESATDTEQYFGITTEDGSLHAGYRNKPGGSRSLEDSRDALHAARRPATAQRRSGPIATRVEPGSRQNLPVRSRTCRRQKRP